MRASRILNNIFKHCGAKRAFQKKLHCSDRVSKCRVTTISPLVNKFNKNQTKIISFNTLRERMGLFGNVRLMDPEGFVLIKELAMRKTDELVAEALDPKRNRTMVEIFDELSDSLCQVADLAEFIRIAHPSSAYCRMAEEASVGINGLVEKLNTNVPLYKVLRDVSTHGDKMPTTTNDKHIVESFLHDFEQSAIHLNDSKRDRVVYLNEYILYLGSIFMRDAHQHCSVQRSQIDRSIQHFFPRDGENLIISGLFSDCPNEKARETAYRLYLQKNSEQAAILDELLSYRDELAKLCGYPTYVHRAVKGSIADTPEMISDFLTNLSAATKEHSDSELAELQKIKSENSDQKLMPWDVPYLVATSKYKSFNVDASSLRPYFSIGACMDGLNNIFQSIYGISLEAEDPHPGEIWHSDIYKLAVKSSTEGILGYIYCDFFNRTNKPTHECHFTVRGGRDLGNGKYQLPVVVLMLNFPSPTLITPSLLSPGMVENLFHEFGHAMHSMLGRTKYQHVSGTRCSTDLAEVPSVLMEYFASDPRVLLTFARHYKTGQMIHEDLLHCLCESKRMYVAHDIQLQIFYSMLDQRLHLNTSENDKVKILEETQNEFYGLPYVPNTSGHLRFSHLVGYGGKYYSYLMSRAVASWIWHSCFKDDPFSRAMGEKYRQEILAHGGGRPPRQLIRNFLQKEVTPSNLVSSLISDLNSRNL